MFTRHRGQATIFVPCAGPVPPTGRVITTLIPAAELAVIEHRGPPTDIDRAYGIPGQLRGTPRARNLQFRCRLLPEMPARLHSEHSRLPILAGVLS